MWLKCRRLLFPSLKVLFITINPSLEMSSTFLVLISLLPNSSPSVGIRFGWGISILLILMINNYTCILRRVYLDFICMRKLLGIVFGLCISSLPELFSTEMGFSLDTRSFRTVFNLLHHFKSNAFLFSMRVFPCFDHPNLPCVFCGSSSLFSLFQFYGSSLRFLCS